MTLDPVVAAHIEADVARYDDLDNDGFDWTPRYLVALVARFSDSPALPEIVQIVKRWHDRQQVEP